MGRGRRQKKTYLAFEEAFWWGHSDFHFCLQVLISKAYARESNFLPLPLISTDNYDRNGRRWGS